MTKIIAQHVRLKNFVHFLVDLKEKNNDNPWNPDGQLSTHLLRIQRHLHINPEKKVGRN